jgi:hypothetical protein
VRDNQPAAFFVANLDTYGGNSGSPVFNSTTHDVEDVLVRGENDFVQQGGCRVSLVCPNTGCQGEDCTRTTEFASFLQPGFPDWELLDNNPATVAIGWQKIDNNAASVSIVAAGGQLYQLHGNGLIWRYTGWLPRQALRAASMTTLDLTSFTQRLATAIDAARSLVQIEAWIASQPHVKSVRLTDHLLKSNPPQRELVVELATPDGGPTTRVVNVFDLGNQCFQLRDLHDP